jgi:hypothetical protein
VVRVREEYLYKYNGQQNGAGKGEVHAPVRKQRPDKLAVIDQWGRVKEMNRNRSRSITTRASAREGAEEEDIVLEPLILEALYAEEDKGKEVVSLRSTSSKQENDKVQIGKIDAPLDSKHHKYGTEGGHHAHGKQAEHSHQLVLYTVTVTVMKVESRRKKAGSANEHSHFPCGCHKHRPIGLRALAS